MCFLDGWTEDAARLFRILTFSTYSQIPTFYAGGSITVQQNKEIYVIGTT